METKSESAVLVDSSVNISESSEKRINKECILKILRAHKVDTTAVSFDVAIEQVIPTLYKAKVNIPEAFFKDLAFELNMHFIDFSRVKQIYSNQFKSQLVTVLPYEIIRQYNIVPVEIGKTCAKFATSNPLDTKVKIVLDYLFKNRTLNLCLASSRAIAWTIENVYSKIHNERALLDLYNRTPDQSAYKVLMPAQKYFITSLLIILTLGVVLNSVATFVALFAVVNIGYFVINPVKIYISLKGFQRSKNPIHVTEGEIQWTCPEDLPTYTILVPVYHEARVLAQVMHNIYSINYPKSKLDVKILMEENDSETLAEAKALGLFGAPKKKVQDIPEDQYSTFLKIFDPVVVPKAKITTKPRACNYGLLRAKGELCVIYDAEDSPHPDQLIKAAIVFMRSDDDVACLQSKLNFYNANENLLTRWFSIEYGYWYEFYLPGLDWIDAPIPLGGTSNHFRTTKLDELGRWDPYNVTEDADLGIRLARSKLKTEVINTYTYEEATISLTSWIRQRSRWYKGHLQTYLVHMRHPRRLIKDLSFKQFLNFQLTFGAGVIMPLINPVLWGLTLLTLFTPFALANFFPFYVQLICLFNLTVGNLTYLLLYVVACIKRKDYTSIPYAITMPIYWALISIASLRGLIQLIRNPFYWDKTSHGVSKELTNKP